MRPFAQKQKQPQKPISSTLARSHTATPGLHHHADLMQHFQRTIGNQAVQRVLQAHAEELNAGLAGTAPPHFGHDFSSIPVHTRTEGAIQTKRAINKPGDEYEQEADRIAEQVMRVPAAQLHGACACGGECPKCQSKQPSRYQERLQLKHLLSSNAENIVAPPIVHKVVATPGQPLDSSTRDFMEPRFGQNFSQVRMHADKKAAESARAVNALAYTVGRNVVFGAGQYAPDTKKGRRLLAHELTHVIQQQDALSGANAARLQRQVPEDITAQVGPVSGQGGLIHDASRKRMSIIVGPQDTLRTIAQRLLPIWNTAQPFTPPVTTTPRPVTQLSEEQLAKGFLVYNRYYLAVPSMTEWKVGLRFPLPIEVNQATGERTLHPDLIVTWANSFDPAWEPLLDMTPAATAVPAQEELEQSVRTFLQENESLTARGIHLSTRVLRNARDAEPFIQEVFRQAASEAFDLALAFMDQIVIHQFDILASQTAGQSIIATIRNALANAPASPSSDQQQSFARANRLLNRSGVFSTATAERFRDIYVTEVPGCHCMAAVYHGLEGLFSEGVSQSIQDQVARESREVMRRTGRDTNHMDRIMETVRARGLAGPETRLAHQAASNTWQPDPEATVLGMTHPNIAGWYFFGLSLHGAYHSVILAVDKSDPASPRIYWMDQFSRGFSNDVTGALMDEMRGFRPSYGFAPSRLWQIIPAADTLIILD